MSAHYNVFGCVCDWERVKLGARISFKKIENKWEKEGERVGGKSRQSEITFREWEIESGGREREGANGACMRLNHANEENKRPVVVAVVRLSALNKALS